MSAKCYWFTGLSGAGKTTYSELFAERLRSLGYKVVLLDGDELRLIMNSSSFTSHDRLQLGYKYFSLVKLIISQDVNVIIAAIGMFDDLRRWNRANIANYYEIYLDVPKNILVSRDPKGIYKKFYNNEVSNLAGFDLKIEYPTNPHFHFKWSNDKSFDLIIDELIDHFLSS